MLWRRLRHAVVRAWASGLRVLHARTLLVLFLLLCLGGGCLLWHLSTTQTTLIAAIALQDATFYAQALAEVRTLYTSEVVERVRQHGISVTDDYATQEGAIPLPVTLSMLLGQRLGAYESGAQSHLYSPYPFPSRREESGLRDAFRQAAWTALQRQPAQPFYRFEDVRGQRVLRYATADIMHPGCVNCHNTHPQSPKTDWQVGEVRGVLEVVVPLEAAMVQTRAGMRGTLALLVGMATLGLSGVALVMGTLRRNAAALEQRADLLEREIAERQRVTEALRASESRYRHIIDAAADAIISIDEQGVIQEFNHAAETMFGMTHAEVMGHPLTPLMPPRFRALHSAGLQRYLATSQRHLPSWRNIELPGLTKDGREFPMEVSFSLLEVGDHKVLTGVLRDITARKHVEAALEQARLSAEAATRAKSEFLANMSHELRTPMNAIIGFTRLVMRRSQAVLPQRQYENLEKILISAEHLLTLINTVLDLAKIEAGHMEVRAADCALEPLIDLCLRTVEPLIPNARLRLVKTLDAAVPMVVTDEGKLKQILMNLLSNAVKFTPEGTVTVTTQRHAGMLRLVVSDTGIGIPAEALGLIFGEFRQANSSTTREYGGTGLGLSISRHLAHLLGGEITVQSTVGVGSTFTVTLPLRTPREALPLPAPTVPPGVPHPARVVLVIDDDPDVLYLLRENLSEAGYHVIGAANGEEGLRQARALRPFAITLDILMPYRDGWQVLHDLKADPTTRDLPVVILSIVDNKDLGYRLGAFDYLLKPFDREAILAALARMPSRQGRLLVVDDDPHVAVLVRQLLEGEPYAISTADDGEAALAALAQQRPDIILLDLMMPRLDGFGVLTALQREPAYRDIPVLVLTAKTLSAAEQALLQERVLTVLEKRGLEHGVLLQELRAALQHYGGPAAPRA